MFHPQLRQNRGKPLRKKLKRHAFHGNDSRHGRLRSGISSDQDARLFFLIRNWQHMHCRCGLRSQVGPASLSDGISLCHDPGRDANIKIDMGGCVCSRSFTSPSVGNIVRNPHRLPSATLLSVLRFDFLRRGPSPPPELLDRCHRKHQLPSDTCVLQASVRKEKPLLTCPAS